MQKLIYFISLMVLLFTSCTKDKEASIVGLWVEIDIYMQQQSGAFTWGNNPRFPYQLNLKENGEYFTASDIPGSKGVYDYNHATRQIRFGTVTSGASYINTVSVLNDDNLQIDNYLNGILVRKVKYQRH